MSNKFGEKLPRPRDNRTDEQKREQWLRDRAAIRGISHKELQEELPPGRSR